MDMRIVISEFLHPKNWTTNFIGPKHDPNSNDLLLSPSQLGIITGTFIILFLNYQTDAKTKIRNNLLPALNLIDFKESLLVLACLIPTILLLPFILTIFLVFQIKKNWVGYKLKHDKSTGFKSFLNGEDVVWTIDESISKSIINVLGYVSDTPQDKGTLPENLLSALRERLHSKLMVPKQFPKIFYLRRKQDGFHYWTENNPLTPSDYVRFMNPYLNDSNENEIINENEFRQTISELSNEPMPGDNTALFEMLVGQHPIKGSDGLKYPIVFRIHHALGDGVALLRLLLETMCDQEKNEEFSEQNCRPEIPKVKPRNFVGNFIEEIKKKFNSVFNIYTWILINHLVKAPSVLYKMGAREIDRNDIHPQKLCGKKVTNWFFETTSNDKMPLLTLIKLIRRKAGNVRFSNILLAALSKSLSDYFKKRDLEVPKDMTIVLPARLYNGKEDHQLEMSNKFSVGYQTLPIRNPTEFMSDKSLMYSRIQKIKKYSDYLAMAPDYHINYWMMTIFAAILPDHILRTAMESKHSTMAVSNLPGPNFAIKINNLELKNIGFFLPNIGQTACVLSVLSYNNKLHFGILADETSVPTEEDLGEIINGMIKEIQFMADNLLK